MADDPGEGKGILDQLIEEAFKKGKVSATQDDFAVNLRTTDKDGHEHVIEGIPVSQAKDWLYKQFGIGTPPAKEGGKEGDGKEGGGQAGPPTLKTFFGGKAASG
jgi:hypothetical protein